MQKSRDRDGAIFIETDVGGKRLIGYRAIRDGQMGIAYAKEGEVLGFKPMGQFLEEFYTGVFLSTADKRFDQTIVCSDRREKIR